MATAMAMAMATVMATVMAATGSSTNMASATSAFRSNSSRSSRTPRRRHRKQSLAGVAATVVVAAALAAEVARISLGAYYSEIHPSRALMLAPQSPDALTATAMVDIGRAAATSSAPDRLTFDRLQLAAAAAPLEPEPFLVQGALAEREGDLARAE